jgi:hypothetical protein
MQAGKHRHVPAAAAAAAAAVHSTAYTAAVGGCSAQHAPAGRTSGQLVMQQLLSRQTELVQQLQQLTLLQDAAAAAAGATILATQHREPARSAAAAVEELASAAGRAAECMREFGLAVAVQFPAAALCCNPACVNLQGSSEAALLGPGSRCSGCKVARFCSKECSMAAWKAGHKAVCKRLKAAGAVAVAT